MNDFILDIQICEDNVQKHEQDSEEEISPPEITQTPQPVLSKRKETKIQNDTEYWTDEEIKEDKIDFEKE